MEERAETEFDRRYYIWGREQLLEQLLAGFPHIHARDRHGGVYLSALASFTPQEREAIALARHRQFHSTVADAVGVPRPPSTVERLLEKYELAWHRVNAETTFHRHTMANALGSSRIDHTALRKAVKAAALPLLGSHGSSRRGGSRIWTYHEELGGYKLETTFDAAGRMTAYDLAYRQAISVQQIASRPMQGICANSWLGVASVNASWFAAEAEVTGAISHMLMLCLHFRAALPILLEGLMP